jgi:hypothetical protein
VAVADHEPVDPAVLPVPVSVHVDEELTVSPS